MALPLSPSTTYTARNTPSIKAQDLNDLQTYLSGLYVGAYTVKALKVDGTGGAASSQPAGSIAASGNGSFGGTLLSTTPTSKSLWIPGSNWSTVNGTWNRNISGASVTATAGSAQINTSVPLPFSANGSAALTGLSLLITAAAGGGLFRLFYFNGTTDTIVSSVTVSTPGVQTISLAPTGNISDATHYLWMNYTSGGADTVSGALMTYTSNVF